MQLDIILTSLHDDQAIAGVLGLPALITCKEADSKLGLAELLMKTILRNLTSHTVSAVNCLSVIQLSVVSIQDCTVN